MVPALGWWVQDRERPEELQCGGAARPSGKGLRGAEQYFSLTEAQHSVAAAYSTSLPACSPAIVPQLPTAG